MELVDHAEHPVDDEAALYAANRHAVFDLALRRLGSVPEAENVVQEAFARTLRAMRTSEVAHPRAYLFRTAHNLTIDRFRQRNREADLGDEPAAPSGSSSPEDHQRVRDAVAALPAPQRDVLALRYGDDLSFRGIAVRLALSRNAVHNRHQRALAALRRALGLETP